MKNLIILTLLLGMVSCSNISIGDFKQEKNCSPRALAYLDSVSKGEVAHKSSKAEGERTGKKLTEITSAMVPQVKSCFQASLAAHTISEGRMVCSVLGISEKGALSFIDVQDQNNSIPEDLRKCIIDVVSHGDFSSVKGPLSVVQPFNFYSIHNQ